MDNDNDVAQALPIVHRADDAYVVEDGISEDYDAGSNNHCEEVVTAFNVTVLPDDEEEDDGDNNNSEDEDNSKMITEEDDDKEVSSPVRKKKKKKKKKVRHYCAVLYYIPIRLHLFMTHVHSSYN